jgi:signal transduction histidine kinase
MTLSPVLDSVVPRPAAARRDGAAEDQGLTLFLSRPLEPILGALAVVALIVAAILFARTAGLIAALWAANGVAVGLWLRRDRGRTYDLCFGGLLTIAIVVAELLVGNGYQQTALFTAANMLEIVTAVFLARRFGAGLNLATMDGVRRFLLTAVVLAPLPAAGLAAVGLNLIDGADFNATFLTWWFGHALGIAGIGGVILGLGRRESVRLRRPAKIVEAAVLLSAVGALFFTVFSPLAIPLGVLSMPLILLIAVRLRFVGMSLAVIVVSCLAVGGSMQGYGPYANLFDGPGRAIMAQILVLMGYLPAILIAGALEERDGLTRAAQLAQARAERASDGKSRLLANVSHEIKSPIAGVIGIAELWRDGKLGEVSATQVEMSDMLVKTARQIEALAYDLLDVSRAEAGAVSVDLKPVDVGALLEDIRRAAAIRPEAHGVRLEIVTTGDKLVAEADSVRLSQVLSNLTSNALKYGASGGVVRFKAEPIDGNRVRISVIDHGPGLSETKQAELFEPFNRLGMEKSAIEGHGIGLALAKRLVELQKGRIGVDSRPGEGAAFWIELPAA